MTMYDELRGNLIAQATHFHFNDETSLLLLKAADAIEELQQITAHYEEESKGWWLAACDAKEERERLKEQIPKWIPVTERLPEEKDRYLTVSIEPWFGTTVVDTMRWSGVWMYDGRQAEATVTHWMPLPQPTKEGEA